MRPFSGVRASAFKMRQPRARLFRNVCCGWVVPRRLPRLRCCARVLDLADSAEHVFTLFNATSEQTQPNRKAKQKSHAQLRMAGSVPADITAGGSIVPNGQAITVAGSLRGCRTTAVRGSCFGACLGANCDAQSWKTTWDTTRAQTSVADDFVATPTKGTRSIQSFAPRSSQTRDETFQASLQESSPNGPTA